MFLLTNRVIVHRFVYLYIVLRCPAAKTFVDYWLPPMPLYHKNKNNNRLSRRKNNNKNLKFVVWTWSDIYFVGLQPPYRAIFILCSIDKSDCLVDAAHSYTTITRKRRRNTFYQNLIDYTWIMNMYGCKIYEIQ